LRRNSTSEAPRLADLPLLIASELIGRVQPHRRAIVEQRGQASRQALAVAGQRPIEDRVELRIVERAVGFGLMLREPAAADRLRIGSEPRIDRFERYLFHFFSPPFAR
jgi:hypothetical protein